MTKIKFSPLVPLKFIEMRSVIMDIKHIDGRTDTTYYSTIILYSLCKERMKELLMPSFETIDVNQEIPALYT
jgi:hypothetical protein